MYCINLYCIGFTSLYLVYLSCYFTRFSHFLSDYLISILDTFFKAMHSSLRQKIEHIKETVESFEATVKLLDSNIPCKITFRCKLPRSKRDYVNCHASISVTLFIVNKMAIVTACFYSSNAQLLMISIQLKARTVMMKKILIYPLARESRFIISIIERDHSDKSSVIFKILRESFGRSMEHPYLSRLTFKLNFHPRIFLSDNEGY